MRGGSIRLKPGSGKFIQLSSGQALEIARGMTTRGDVIEHVKDEAQVSGVRQNSAAFKQRVAIILGALRSIEFDRRREQAFRVVEARLKRVARVRPRAKPKPKPKPKPKGKKVKGKRKRIHGSDHK